MMSQLIFWLKTTVQPTLLINPNPVTNEISQTSKNVVLLERCKSLKFKPTNKTRFKATWSTQKNLFLLKSTLHNKIKRRINLTSKAASLTTHMQIKMKQKIYLLPWYPGKGQVMIEYHQFENITFIVMGQRKGCRSFMWNGEDPIYRSNTTYIQHLSK